MAMATFRTELKCRFVLVIHGWLVLHLTNDVGQSDHFRRRLLEPVRDAHGLEPKVVDWLASVHLLNEQRAWVAVDGLDRGKRRLHPVLIGRITVDHGREHILRLLLLLLGAALVAVGRS